MTSETESNEKKARWAHLGFRIFSLATTILMTFSLFREIKSGYIATEDGAPTVFRMEHPAMFWMVIAGYVPMIVLSLYFSARGFKLEKAG